MVDTTDTRYARALETFTRLETAAELAIGGSPAATVAQHLVRQALGAARATLALALDADDPALREAYANAAGRQITSVRFDVARMAGDGVEMTAEYRRALSHLAVACQDTVNTHRPRLVHLD